MVRHLLIALVVAAPQPSGLIALQEADARVATVGWRLQTANAGLCRDLAPLSGLLIHALAQYEPASRDEAKTLFKLDDRPQVAAVVAGGAADRVGIRRGDIIAAIDDRPTPSAATRKASYDGVAATETQLEAALAMPPARLSVVSGGTPRTIDLAGDPGCASRVQLVPGTKLNAFADGQYVQITGAMYDFAQTDTELAISLAHELAHNILKHRNRLDEAKVSRGLFAGFGKSGAAFRATEYEADRLGVWLVVRAGYDVDAVIPYWQRIGRKTGLGILSAGTHPRWKERIARIAEAVAEVKAQRVAGGPLIPPAQQSSSQAGIRR